MGMPDKRVLETRFIVAAALTLPVVVLAMGPMAAPTLFPHASLRWSGWAQLFLTTPVFFWSGAFFLRRWWRSLTPWDPNMFTLTVTGTGAAYVYSAVAVIASRWVPAAFQGPHGVPLYFEAASVVTSIVLLGQILEQGAHARTEDAVRALMDLAPKQVHRLGLDNREEDVPLGAVTVGDRLRVRPGEHVPVDGVILEGTSDVDEAMLTGESVPVPKAPGDQARAGTVSTTGSFIVKAEKLGNDTLLGHIVALVERAKETDPPIARLADRVSGYFVPVVIAAAAVTFALWFALGPEPRFIFALVSAVSVLIIACPCALGLATPVSVVTAIGRGAQAGIIVRDAGALERLASIDTLLMDKTGTLTLGKPRVAAVAVRAGFSEADALRLAASAESSSEHPLARALVAEALTRGLALAPASAFVSEPGVGVSAQVDGCRVDVGRDPAPGDSGDEATRIQVSIDRVPAAIISLRDEVRPGSLAAVRALQALGLKVVMITGDREAPARRVATELGLDDVHAQVSPSGKQEWVRTYRARGARVGFAGDGINDAPALASADAGIAMGTGTDVAMTSAGLVLVKGDLAALVRAVRLSRATLRTIRQNLFWAFSYNLLGLPLAGGALYPLTGWLLSPMLAGVAMSLSSISVVLNALRLRRVVL